MSKVNAVYHIVFATKNRQMTISNEHREDLYRYIWSLLKEYNCHLYRISGIPNHIHMLINLNPTIALSTLMREIKSRSSAWLKSDERFPDFTGWGREYFATTVTYNDRNGVIEYIKSQQRHHAVTDFDEELSRLYNNNNMVMYPQDLR